MRQKFGMKQDNKNYYLITLRIFVLTNQYLDSKHDDLLGKTEDKRERWGMSWEQRASEMKHILNQVRPQGNCPGCKSRAM